MALQLAYTSPVDGTPAPAAYAHVDDSSTRLAVGQVNINVSLYYDRAAYLAGLAPIFTYPPFVLTVAELVNPNSNFIGALIAQLQGGTILSPRDAILSSLYLILKTRPEFGSAVDA